MAIKGQIDLETGESKRTGGKIHQKPYNYRDDRKEVATILVDMLRDASNGDKKLAPWANEMISLNPNYRNTITGTTYKGGNIFRIAIGNRLRYLRNAELKANATHNEERYNALSQKNNLTPREVEEFKAVQSERNERLAFANWTGNDPRFVTMSGVQNMNAKRPKDEPEIRIRKGTKAIARIEYNKRFEYGTPEWEEEIKRIEKKNPSRAQMLIGDKRDIWINKPTNIFSAECCDNFPPLVDEKQLTKTEIHENCETILVGSEAPIVYDGGGKNYYSLGEDTIHLTRRDYFLSNEAFYATALHEIAHSTGHEDRLNRELGKSFGTLEDYALEELNAEFAAAMLSEKYGLPMTEERLNNHAVYLKSWADAIENNPNALDLAMTNASKIVDYIEQNIYSLGKERMQQEQENNITKEQNININDEFNQFKLDDYVFSENISSKFIGPTLPEKSYDDYNRENLARFNIPYDVNSSRNFITNSEDIWLRGNNEYIFELVKMYTEDFKSKHNIDKLPISYYEAVESNVTDEFIDSYYGEFIREADSAFFEDYGRANEEYVSSDLYYSGGGKEVKSWVSDYLFEHPEVFSAIKTMENSMLGYINEHGTLKGYRFSIDNYTFSEDFSNKYAQYITGYSDFLKKRLEVEVLPNSFYQSIEQLAKELEVELASENDHALVSSSLLKYLSDRAENIHIAKLSNRTFDKEFLKLADSNRLTIDNYTFNSEFSYKNKPQFRESIEDIKTRSKLEVLPNSFYESLEKLDAMLIENNIYINVMKYVNGKYKYLNDLDKEYNLDSNNKVISEFDREINKLLSNQQDKQLPSLEEIKTRDNLSYVTPPPIPEAPKREVVQDTSIEERLAKLAEERGLDYAKIQRAVEEETATWTKNGGYQEPVVISRIPDKKYYISKDNFDEICQNRKEIEARINAMDPKDKGLWIRHANNTLQYHKFNNGKECSVKQAKVLATFVDQLQFDRQNNAYLSQGEWGKIMDNKHGGREDFFERTKHDLEYAKFTVERIKNTIRDGKFANGKSPSDNQMKHIIASRDQIGRYINKLEKEKSRTR
jgi:antirestriction protein ArdC